MSDDGLAEKVGRFAGDALPQSVDALIDVGMHPKDHNDIKALAVALVA